MASPIKSVTQGPQAFQPKGEVRDALQRAAQKTGVDFQYLVDTARRESSFRPGLTVNTSSATGLFQFIEQTWLASVKNDGAKFGLTAEANAITRQADGRYRVSDPQARADILALRKDPALSANFAALLTKKNSAYLQQAIGRAPNAGELYAAHFLGAKGAANLINAVERAPNARAADIFPAAAKANKTLFYAQDGAARSVADVHRELLSRHSAEKVGFRPAQDPADTLASHAPKSERVLNAQEAGFLAKHFNSGLTAFSAKENASDPSFVAVLGQDNQKKQQLFERKSTIQQPIASPIDNTPIPSRYGRMEEEGPSYTRPVVTTPPTPSALISETGKSLFDPVAPKRDEADKLPSGSPLDLRAYRKR